MHELIDVICGIAAHVCAHGHHAAHDVGTKQEGGNSDLETLSIQQRIDYAHATMLGPADVTSVADLCLAVGVATSSILATESSSVGWDHVEPSALSR